MNSAVFPSVQAMRARYLINGDGVATSVAFAKTDIQSALWRDPFFMIDDPNVYIGDWHKFHFGRPHPDGTPGLTIAEKIGNRVKPIMRDFFLGEIYHAAPARITNPPVPPHTPYHYQLAGREARDVRNEFTGPRFKHMDWRGLLDYPEIADTP